MYFSVRNVEPKENYTLVVTFENGETKLFDMKPYLNTGIFRDLKNVDVFNTVHVSFNSVAWANEADFDPEALYEGGIPVAEKNEI